MTINGPKTQSTINFTSGRDVTDAITVTMPDMKLHASYGTHELNAVLTGTYHQILSRPY
jgi:hypothetical protein